LIIQDGAKDAKALAQDKISLATKKALRAMRDDLDAEGGTGVLAEPLNP
jgi:hypothetical protein